MDGESSSLASSSGSGGNGVESSGKKLFIGGLPPDAKSEALRSYFSKYGEVVDPVVVYDRVSGRSRGFGFVSFSNSDSAERALQEREHQIDGKKVEVKRATPRGDNGKYIDQAHSQYDRNHQGLGPNISNGHQSNPKKIFVGGLPTSMTLETFKSYFENNYGKVEDAAIIYDSHTQRPRGFGFITFECENAVDRVMESGSSSADGKCFHDIAGKAVEVKVAVPKTVNHEPPARNGLCGAYGQDSVIYPAYGPGQGGYLQAAPLPFHCAPIQYPRWYPNGNHPFYFNHWNGWTYVTPSFDPAWYHGMSAAFPSGSTLDNSSGSEEQTGNNHQGV